MQNKEKSRTHVIIEDGEVVYEERSGSRPRGLKANLRVAAMAIIATAVVIFVLIPLSLLGLAIFGGLLLLAVIVVGIGIITGKIGPIGKGQRWRR